jgi:hypothetical protein
VCSLSTIFTKGDPQTINNFDHVPIGLCLINHEYFEILFWKHVLQHCFIKLYPRDLMSVDVLKLHVTNHYGHHCTISRIVHMINHSCLASNTLHMIKHDPNILRIPYKLHSCDKAHSTPHMIYWHLENEHLCPRTCLRKQHSWM